MLKMTQRIDEKIYNCRLQADSMMYACWAIVSRPRTEFINAKNNDFEGRKAVPHMKEFTEFKSVGIESKNNHQCYGPVAFSAGDLREF